MWIPSAPHALFARATARPPACSRIGASSVTAVVTGDVLRGDLVTGDIITASATTAGRDQRCHLTVRGSAAPHPRSSPLPHPTGAT